MREQPDEARLFDSILAADDGAEIDLRPAFGKLRSEHVFQLVHQWQDEGLLTYDRNWFLVRLTDAGRRRKEGEE
jgi:hypothetical protein